MPLHAFHPPTPATQKKRFTIKNMACSFRTTKVGENTIQLYIGGELAWEKPVEVLDTVTRSEWGADAPDVGGMTASSTLDSMTIHHSAEDADGAEEVRRIQDLHMSNYPYWVTGNGWADIGYHFLVGQDGTIYEGRSLEGAPGSSGGPYTVGSHVALNNTNAGIGVCLLGQYESTSGETLTAFTESRQEYMEKAMTAIARRYGVEHDSISYHRERALSGHGTECPGDRIIPKMADIIENVRRNLD